MGIKKRTDGADLREFIKAYVDCALWASTAHRAPDMGEDDDTSMDQYGYTWDDIAPVERRKLIKDCISFWDANSKLLQADPGQAGHDYWLTRNRHGAGFWDGDWPEDVGKELSNAARAAGSLDLYVGDDELIYGF